MSITCVYLNCIQQHGNLSSHHFEEHTSAADKDKWAVRETSWLCLSCYSILSSHTHLCCCALVSSCPCLTLYLGNTLAGQHTPCIFVPQYGSLALPYWGTKVQECALKMTKRKAWACCFSLIGTNCTDNAETGCPCCSPGHLLRWVEPHLQTDVETPLWCSLPAPAAVQRKEAIWPYGAMYPLSAGLLLATAKSATNEFPNWREGGVVLSDILITWTSCISLHCSGRASCTAENLPS